MCIFLRSLCKQMLFISRFWRRITFLKQKSDFIVVLKSENMVNMCQIAFTFSIILFGGYSSGHPYAMLTIAGIANYYIRPRWQPLGRTVSRLPKPMPRPFGESNCLHCVLHALTNHSKYWQSLK